MEFADVVRVLDRLESHAQRSSDRWIRIAARSAAAVGAVLLWAEWVHHRGSRRHLGTRPGRTGSGEVVVVLGCRNHGRRANVLNRWRVRAGLRSLDPAGGPTGLVLSGGPVGGDTPEAELMAAYARRALGYRGNITTENTSRSTWENVVNVIPLMEGADRIKIVSNSLHAEKARIYLRRLRPDLADRLVAAADHRFGDLILVKPLLAVRGLQNLRRLSQRQPQQPGAR